MSKPIQHAQIDTIAELWAKPRTPHAWDEEFDGDGSLPAGWSENFTPSSSEVDATAGFSSGGIRRSINGWRKSCYAIQHDSVSTLAYLYKAVTLPTDIFFWSRGTFSYRHGGTNNDARTTLRIWADSGGSPSGTDYASFHFQESDTSVSIQIYIIEGGSNTYNRTLTNQGTTGQGQYYEYLGIQKIGSTYHFWAFTGNGHMFYAGNKTLSFTPGHVGFDFDNTSTAGSGNSISTVDFLRFKESTTFLPGYGD